MYTFVKGFSRRDGLLVYIGTVRCPRQLSSKNSFDLSNVHRIIIFYIKFGAFFDCERRTQKTLPISTNIEYNKGKRENR